MTRATLWIIAQCAYAASLTLFVGCDQSGMPTQSVSSPNGHDLSNASKADAAPNAEPMSLQEFKDSVERHVNAGNYSAARELLMRTRLHSMIGEAATAGPRRSPEYWAVMTVGVVIPGMPQEFAALHDRTELWVIPGTSDSQPLGDAQKWQVEATQAASTFNQMLDDWLRNDENDREAGDPKQQP